MELRKALESDRAAVMLLYRSAIGMEGCVWDEGYPTYTELDGDLAAGALYVYTDGDEIVGAVSVLAERELDVLPEWKYSDGRQCEIARVVIAAERRSRGLAAEMLTELFCLLKEQGVSAVHLLAAKENTAAQKTYARLGFEILSEHFMFGHEYCSAELKL